MTATRGLQAAFLVAVFLGLTGCDQPERVERDSFGSQLLRETFAAIGRGESNAALRQVDKLRAEFGEDLFLSMATERERDRVTMLGVNACLEKGDLTGAQRFLRDELARRGKVPVILDSEARVAALLALRGYVGQMPFRSSEEASAALRSLGSFTDRLNASPSYPLWHRQQLDMIAALQESERRESLRQLVLESDWRSATDPEFVPLILAQIAAADPNGPLGRTLLSAAETTGTRVPADAAPDVRMLHAAIGLWTLGTSASGPATTDDADAPGCMSERVLAAVRAGQRGGWRDALAFVEQAEAVAPVPSGHMEAIFRPLALPAGQYLAKPWRSPFPSFTDCLHRIAQIRDDAL